jgi:hypothetical protein
MFSLPKEKTLKYLGRFFFLITGLAVLFGSLVLSGLEIMANEKKANNLRSIPIEYVDEEDTEKKVQVYKVPESRIGPDNIKYPIKKLRDTLWIELSQIPKEKSEVCLLIADKRMFEAIELIKKKKDDELIIKTLNESILHLKEAKNILSKENKKDIEISKVDLQIDQAGLAYEDIVKSFNYKNEEINKTIDDLEEWNQKNYEEKEK